MLAPRLVFHPVGVVPPSGPSASPLSANQWWSAWNWEPALLLGLLGLAGLYVCGVCRLWGRAGSGHGIPYWQAAAFAGGWLALFVALVSPLDALGTVLFSAHMAQHELLMLIAAPLLALGQPLVGCLWGLPTEWRHDIGHWWGRSTTMRSVWHTLTAPLVVWVLHAGVLWIWHAPMLYQAALEWQVMHLLQHVSFLGSALLFWWAFLHGRHGRMSYGIAVVAIFTTAIHSSVLGALLTFAFSPWYPVYRETTAAWGLSPLEDQQLAGLIMWVPAGVIYMVAGLALFAAWLAEAERRVRQREAQVLADRPR